MVRETGEKIRLSVKDYVALAGLLIGTATAAAGGVWQLLDNTYARKDDIVVVQQRITTHETQFQLHEARFESARDLATTTQSSLQKQMDDVNDGLDKVNDNLVRIMVKLGLEPRSSR